MPPKSASKAKTGPASKPAAVDLTLSSSDDDVPVKKVTSKAAASNATASKPSTPASKSNGKRKAEESMSESSDDEPVKPAKKRASLGGAAGTKKAGKAKVESSSDEDNYKASKTARGDDEDDDDEESEEEDVKPAKKAAAPKKATPRKAAPRASTSKAKVKDEDVDMEDEADKKPKAKWAGPQQRAGPSNPGSKPIPDGVPDCLGGLTIVFTGELESLGRDEATNLAKRYGAKVTSSVSSKTSYVVLGQGAGPKKEEMIKKNKIPVLDEDGFLRLIETRGAKDLDKKYLDKQKEEDKKIKAAAKAIHIDPNMSKDALWTVKYAPTSLKELCGNPGIVEKLQKWLEAWPKNLKSNFNKPGNEGWGIFRAAMLSGPPGIGKTTTAHLVAKLAGYNVIEMNASDTRSKKLLETMLRSTVDNTVLDGFLTGKAKDGEDVPHLTTRSCLIMDEVDGTSAGDRGGIGALNALIKKTKVPIICIANDKSLQKMKPLIATTYQLPFRRPEAASIRSRLMTIAFKEGLKIDKTVSDQLVQGTQSDIRQMINILSTWKLSSDKMTFDETKKLTDSRDPNALSTPFALMDKLFSPYAFSATSNARINEKLEVYFQEFDMLPLFVQENYLKHKYARASKANPREAAWKKMELTSKAADAISDGDMVDRMIHGSQQQWSLMPVHGMLSTVTPAFHCYGQGSFGNWNNSGDSMGSARSFPGWFGKNSTQGRLQRLLTDIQIRMRLKVSGDRREIRQSYIPGLFSKLVKPLIEDGVDAIPGVIEGMDEYYLTKDEWDGLVEMGIGEMTPEPLLKKIDTKTKTAFTRKYNTSDHPIPFHKGTDIAPMKKSAAAEKPDLEEAFEVEVDEAEDEEKEKKFKKGEDENTIKDKLVKAKKAPAKKAAPAAKKPAATKAAEKK